MKYIDINSEETTNLEEIYNDTIIVRKVKALSGDIADLSKLIKVSTELPTKESYQYVIALLPFCSNYSKTDETDIEMNQLIRYCEYTNLVVDSPFNKRIELRLYYENL